MAIPRPAGTFTALLPPPYPPLPSDPFTNDEDPADIIAPGSSDEDDEQTPEKSVHAALRRRRIRAKAEGYLRGEQLYIHSARLRGPVVNNPWKKRLKVVDKMTEENTMGTPTNAPPRSSGGRTTPLKSVTKSLPQYFTAGKSAVGSPVAVNKLADKESLGLNPQHERIELSEQNMVGRNPAQVATSSVQQDSSMQNSPEAQQTVGLSLQPTDTAILGVSAEFSSDPFEVTDTSSKSSPRETISRQGISDGTVPIQQPSDTIITSEVDGSKRRTKIDFTAVSPTYGTRKSKSTAGKKKTVATEQVQCSPEERKRSTVEITQSVISQYLVNDAHEKLQNTVTGAAKDQSKDSEKENRPEGTPMSPTTISKQVQPIPSKTIGAALDTPETSPSKAGTPRKITPGKIHRFGRELSPHYPRPSPFMKPLQSPTDTGTPAKTPSVSPERDSEPVQEEDHPKTPFQNTQQQLLAARQGFFDALEESPIVFGGETPGVPLTTTKARTPATTKLTETPAPKVSFGHQMILEDGNPPSTTTKKDAEDIWNKVLKTPAAANAAAETPVPDPIKIPGTDKQDPQLSKMPSVAFESTANSDETEDLNSLSNPPDIVPFELKPFSAFATPTGSPTHADGRNDMSPLTFSPLTKTQSQALPKRKLNMDYSPPPPATMPSAHKSVKFSTPDEEDDDDDLDATNSRPRFLSSPVDKSHHPLKDNGTPTASLGSSFLISPLVKTRLGMGQQGREEWAEMEKEEEDDDRRLTEEVVKGFCGDVWDIDEELKKMAGVSGKEGTQGKKGRRRTGLGAKTFGSGGRRPGNVGSVGW